MRRSIQFEPVNRGALWTRLSLTTAQLAAMCDLTTRQVSYWAQKGYVPRAPANAERFNGNGIDSCMLIKQALAQGANLSEAARLASAYAAEELAQQPQLATFGPPVLLDLYEKLTAIESTVRLLRSVVEPHLSARDAAARSGRPGGPAAGP